MNVLRHRFPALPSSRRAVAVDRAELRAAVEEQRAGLRVAATGRQVQLIHAVDLNMPLDTVNVFKCCSMPILANEL